MEHGEPADLGGFRQAVGQLGHVSRLAEHGEAVDDIPGDECAVGALEHDGAKTGKPPKSVDNAVQRIRRKAAILFGEDGSPV